MNQEHMISSRSATPFWWGTSERTLDIVRFWLVFSGCLGLLIFRGWDRIEHADFFAEDIRFMGSAFNDGWATLLEQYDFFYHTAPKLIALFGANFVPIENIPLFTNFVCYATTAAAMATISRSAYRWLIPSDGARAALALLMILAPGLTEILGNLAGLHWSLLLWLAVLSLKEPGRPFTVWELLIVVLVGVSAAGSIIFLPIAFLRLLLAGHRCSAAGYSLLSAPKQLRREIVFFSILFIVTAYLFIHFITKDAQVGIDDIDIVVAARDVEELLPRLGYLFIAFYFLHPFLGTQNTSIVLDSLPFYPLFFTALIIVGLLLWRVRSPLGVKFWLIPAWLICLFSLATMLSIVRYWAFYGLFSPPYEEWWFRYNFVFACTGLVFFFLLLRPDNLLKIRQWPVLAAIALIVGYLSQAQATTEWASPPHEYDAFAIERYGTKDYWGRTAERLEESTKTGCPREVRVVAHPNARWRFTYVSPLDSTDCG